MAWQLIEDSFPLVTKVKLNTFLEKASWLKRGLVLGLVKHLQFILLTRGESTLADLETKNKHSLHYKRNMMAKHLRDQGEHKGAFSLKVMDSRKTNYKRVKLRVTELDEEE